MPEINTSSHSRTLADLLPAVTAGRGSSPAFHFADDHGTWIDHSFDQVLTEVRDLTLGLAGLDLHPGDRLAILGNTRPEWTLFDFAAMSAGAIVVPIYQTNSPAECQYVLEHSGARFLVAEDETQLQKIREIRDQVPELERIILMLGEADDATPMEEVRQKGREAGGDTEFRELYSAVRPEDTCKIVYTSGTTGPPKGCVISHGNYRAMLDMVYEINVLKPGETIFLFLPLAHVFALLVQYGTLDTGGRLAYWERDQLLIIPNLAAVKPDFFPSVPRIFEKVHDTAVSAAEAAGGIKGWLFKWAIRTGRRVRAIEEKGGRPGPLLRRKYALADRLVLSKIRDIFGGNLRLALTGAAPIDPDILRFFHAADVPIYEAWGMTETSTGGSANLPGASKIGTVGKAMPGVEFKLGEGGELLMKGPNVFQGYYRNEEATRETLIDGWLHTGDIASIDDDGFVTITGRKKEIIITAGGKNITPVNIETAVRRHKLVSQCVVVGDRRPYLVALISLDQEELTRFAAEKGALDEPRAMINSPAVREELEHHIETVNRDLARVEQIKRFHILPADLSQEGGELTPTLKIKRPVVTRKYALEIERLYAD